MWSTTLIPILFLVQTENPLTALPVLPKVHAHWPLPDDRLDDPTDPLVLDFIRITQAVSVHGLHVNDERLAVALRMTDTVYTEHHMAIVLAVLLRPYHETPTPAQELAWLVDRLEWLRQGIMFCFSVIICFT